MRTTPGPAAGFDLGPEPERWVAWLRQLWQHRGITWALTRKDFQARYKRASLGMLWAVALPLLQGAVIAVVFSRVARFDVGDVPYAAYVLSGMVAWSYVALSVPTATTAVVDGAGLADKVWFPRLSLVLAPSLANLAGLCVSVVLVAAVIGPLLGVAPGLHLATMVPAVALLAALVIGLTLVTSAAHVRFRDVRFLVQAGVLVWFYATPVIYPASLLGRWEAWVDANPATGVVALFRFGLTGEATLARPVAVTVAVAVVALAAGLEAHRRRDRLFVDLL